MMASASGTVLRMVHPAKRSDPLVGGAVRLYFLALAVWPSRKRD